MPAPTPDWRVLYEVLGERGFRLLHRMTGDAALAEDLTHDTFLRVHDGAHQFGARGDVAAWVYRTRLLYSIDRGDTTLLAWFVRRRLQMGSQLMSVVMGVASGVSQPRASLIAAEAQSSMFGNVMNRAGTTSALSVPDLGEEFRSPLVTSIRTLFLSGSLDWNAPPFQAEEVRFGFTDARHIVVGNGGHEQVLPHPEVRKAIVRFLQGEEVDGTRAEWPPLRFVPPTGYHQTRTYPSVPVP